MEIKRPKPSRPYEYGILDISLDTIDDEVKAVLFFKEHEDSPDHHHIILDRNEAYKLFVWLEDNLHSLGGK